MAHLLRGGIALLGIVLLAGGTLYAASELGGEVAVLTTQDAAGRPHTTRVWVVNDGGFTWVRAGQPSSKWFRRLEAHPVVQLERRGSTRSFRAVPVRNAETLDRLHARMAAEYGWADRLIGLTRDGGQSIAVRLDPIETQPVQ